MYIHDHPIPGAFLTTVAKLEPNPPLAVSFPILKFPFSNGLSWPPTAEAWELERNPLLLDAVFLKQRVGNS